LLATTKPPFFFLFAGKTNWVMPEPTLAHLLPRVGEPNNPENMELIKAGWR
jgi:hypothetical protein